MLVFFCFFSFIIRLWIFVWKIECFVITVVTLWKISFCFFLKRYCSWRFLWSREFVELCSVVVFVKLYCCWTVYLYSGYKLLKLLKFLYCFFLNFFPAFSYTPSELVGWFTEWETKMQHRYTMQQHLICIRIVNCHLHVNQHRQCIQRHHRIQSSTTIWTTI